MTETALTPQRHLVLPETCLFAPTELQIGPSLSQNEFSRLGKALASVDQASDLWACDYALAGRERWGDEGLKLSSVATRLSVGYLKVSARIAERFDPARRYANLTREHYRGLCCFPVEWTDTWLPTVAEKGLSARSLRALAVEAYGSDPKAGYSKSKKRSVALAETLYARLKECSPIPKTAVFIEEVLTDWVNNAKPEQKARIAAALSTRDADKVRTRRKVKEPKPAKITEPADVRFQLEKFERATYAERRAEQLAAGASPIPAKVHRGRYKSRVKIVFGECHGLSYLEDNEGTTRLLTKASASRFYSLEKAEDAAREYSEDRGYVCEAFHCERCDVWHVRAKNYGAHVPSQKSAHVGPSASVTAEGNFDGHTPFKPL